MPMQQGEILVAEYTVWAQNPEYDRWILGAGSINYPFIEEESYILNIPGIKNPDFSGEFDRAEVVESLFTFQHAYAFRVITSDGKITWFSGGTEIPVIRIQTARTPTIPSINGSPPTFTSYALEAVEGNILSAFQRSNNVRVISIEFEPISQVKTRTESTYPAAPGVKAKRVILNTPQSRPFADSVTITEIPLKIRYYKKADKPIYYDLLRGYQLDSRTIQDNPLITISSNKDILISYYQENKLEPIEGLRSIDYRTFDCKITANLPFVLPIKDCTLGTLKISDFEVEQLIRSSTVPSNKFPLKYYFEDNIPRLFVEWNVLYNPNNAPETTLDNNGDGVLTLRTLRILGANNNVWNNRLESTPDLNIDLTHPMFIVDNNRSYDWHVKPVAEGIGDLIMDGPRTIESHAFLVKLLRALQVDNYQVENLTSNPPRHYLDWYIKNSSGEKLDKIYKALDAEQWGTNPDDPEIPRVANLGHLISKIASLLGYRPEPDGTFDPVKEKALVRQIVNKNEQIDPAKVGVNNFGSLGMIMRRLNNSFRGKKITADECVIIRDIPQIMAEYQDQLNLALGLQESSAIEIKGSDSTARYDNQLAVMIELLNLAKSNNESIRAALVSSLVAQAQSSEIIAALGLPTVTKSLPVQIDNKIDHLPYKGVSAHRSISQEIAVCTANVGIVLGQVL